MKGAQRDLVVVEPEACGRFDGSSTSKGCVAACRSLRARRAGWMTLDHVGCPWAEAMQVIASWACKNTNPIVQYLKLVVPNR